MLLNELNPTPNSKRPAKRLGRGIGSGLGKTCGKGHKGQWARSGGGVPVGFEGGQMPLVRRLPKHGFTNNFSKEYSCVNVGDLTKFKAGTIVTAELLLERGILSKIEEYGLKVLGDGELTVALTVRASAFTKGAMEKIKKAGGKTEVIKKEKGSK
jgi:large subunit ribosomal protein L15